MRVCRRCHKLKDPRFFVKTTLHSIKTLKQCSSCRLQRSSREKRKRIVSRSSNNIAVKKSKVNPCYRIESRCGARIKSWLGRKSIRVSQVQYELAFITVAIYRFTSADRLSGCFNVGTRVKQAWLRTWDPSVELGRLPHRPYCPLSCFQSKQGCYPLRYNSQRQLCEWQRRMSKQHYMFQTCKYFL